MPPALVLLLSALALPPAVLAKDVPAGTGPTAGNHEPDPRVKRRHS